MGLELLVSWLTPPTVVFCILNLTIGIIFITSNLNPHKKQQTLEEHEGEQPPPQLVRVPSLLERVKSINLSRYRTYQPDPANYTIPAQEQETHKQEPEHKSEESHVTRNKSDREAKATARVLKKSASEKVAATKGEEEVELDARRPATLREKTATFSGEDEAVDEKADDFISRFRQQLKLQRLDSILRYREMLDRGMGR